MIKDYLQQLKEIQQDKAIFQSKAQKKTMIKSLSRQEDKYQAYIIHQMSSQNRIIAAHQLISLIGGPIRVLKAYTFKKLTKYSQGAKSQICSANLIEDKEDRHIGSEVIRSSQSVSVDLVLLKMSLNSIFRYSERRMKEEKREVFAEIVEYCKKKKILFKMTNHIQQFSLRIGLQGLKAAPAKQEDDQLFSDSFSMIAMQKSRMKKVNADESYLSFMLDKQNANLDCPSCKQGYQLILQKDKQLSKMKEELSYLKHLLTDKNLQLKKKQDQIDIYKQGSGDCQSSGELSKNASYYSQLEKQVLGGKRGRKSGSIASNSSQLPKEEISKELLGKYMRETFQLKETMDVAREMCLDLQESIPLSFRVPLQKIVNVLNQGQQISLVDEY